MKIEENVLSIAGDYETIFVDVYGVLFDGVTLYEKALITLEKLRKDGKKVVILSNTTQVSKEAKIGYAKRGLLQNVHYDEFITSGEFLHHTIKNHPDKFSRAMGGKSNTVKCIFIGNANVFEETHLWKVDTYAADFLYVGIPRASYGTVRIDDVFNRAGNKINIEDVIDSDWNDLQDSKGRRGFFEFACQLMNCLHLHKTLLVANPDIFAYSLQDGLSEHMAVVTQGTIAAYYEKLGGKVVYFGKPYAGIFEYAKQLVDAVEPILMIGDTPWTDISGANACGWSSALVMTTGVAHEFLRRMDDSLSEDEKCKILFEKISPRMTKLSGSVIPKHFIKCFAYHIAK
ncbi:MAG: HAD-IA family hydrolase [Holosporaceae bacterium]|jgi:ribonucleotide monophosphatase NagD (HAD superfamily)|nr:HAD-IA family hydrolase [Holosporaceae bacterium]